MDSEIEYLGWAINKKRKSKKPQFITIDDSDSDIEFVGSLPAKNNIKQAFKIGPPPLKKMRTMRSEHRSRSEPQRTVKMDVDKKEENVIEIHSDSEYDNIPGYEMYCEEYPPPRNVQPARDIISELEASVEKLSLGRVQVKSRRRHDIQAGLEYKGVTLNQIYPPAPSIHASRWRTKGLMQSRYRKNEFNTPLKHLTLPLKFRMADACNSVCQAGERLLVSSATPGGGENDPPRDPYNESNTLAFFQKGSESPEFIPSHHLRGYDPGGDGMPDSRYFDVEKACFDPNEPNVFVSSGRDGVLTIWNYTTPKIKNLYSDTGESKFSYVPVRRWGRETYHGHYIHDIVFRKNGLNSHRSIFSAPCRSGHLFVHSYSYDGDQTADYMQQKISNKQMLAHNAQVGVGATLWGEHASSDQLFACTEVRRTSQANVCHYVYDVHSGKVRYTLDKHQNGEELCLSPDGTRLALFTQRNSTLGLDIYDVKNENGRSISNVKEISCKAEKPNITKVAWSPDGILLAVATNEDKVHIYDSRFLTETCLMTLEHKAQIQQSYSISFMEWTTESSFGQKMSLVTGNSGDNCIFLWDTRYSEQTPTVLAQLESQVSVGCLGDPYKREKPLIIGGLDGWVYAYDTSGRIH